MSKRLIELLKGVTIACVPYGIVNKRRAIQSYSYIQDYLDYKKSNNTVSFDQKPNYKSVITVQGFGYSGSGAVVDLLREYRNCNVFGYVDSEGSLSKQVIASGEMDFFRHSGGLFEIEKYIGDNNVFINDSLLHRFLKLISVTEICRISPDVRRAFFSLFDEITENNYWWLNHRFYNAHLLPQGKSEFLYLKPLSVTDYIDIVRKFLVVILNDINEVNKDTIVLDQAFADMNFDYSHYKRYIENLKCIVVYRDPRDVYTFAKIKDVEWIPHSTVEEFINWNRIMYHNYNIENKTFLSVRFEDLVCDYDNTVSIIENYLGLPSSDHTMKLKHLSPMESSKNVGIWKKHIDEYRSDYDIITNQLMPYCYAK